MLRTFWRVILCAVHALALLLVTLVWMNLSWEWGDEVIVAQINEIVRFHILGNSDTATEKFKSELLFVNCSYDKTLASFEDDRASGQRLITDRQKLTSFLKIVNDTTARPRLLVVDLLFDDTTRFDQALHEELTRSSHLILSADLDDDDRLNPRWPELPHAIANYATTTNSFLKYNLLEDTLPYLTTAMVRETEGTKFRPWAGLVRSDPGWWMNSFIVDLPIRESQFESGEVVVWNLGQALQIYSLKEMREVMAGKVVIIGDIFDYDVHNTLLGAMPGPLIVANAYLGMLKGAPKLAFRDLFMVFLLYFLSTLYIIFWKSHREKIMSGDSSRWKVWRFAMQYLTYIVVFSLCTVVLYLWTGRQFQLLLFGLYFNLFEFLMDWFNKKFSAPAIGTAQ